MIHTTVLYAYSFSIYMENTFTIFQNTFSILL